jgi:hypothetical protein
MPMRVLEGIAIGVFIVLLGLALLFLRRGIIGRGAGTIELSWRLSTMVDGRGWSPGLGRFVGDELRWYRIFSFSFRPGRILSRRTLLVETRRAPDGPERRSIAPDWVIVRCMSDNVLIEIAMAESTLTGFLSWIEAVPPGAVSNHIAA